MSNFLSIGIPARNEEESIERVLKNLMRSDVWISTPSENKEIIVCVNASSDKTAELVRTFSKSHPEVKLIETSVPGKNKAINTIVRSSSNRAGTIYFSDADVLVKKSTVGKAVRAVRQNPEIDFAAPLILPSSYFTPRKNRGFTASLYAEAIAYARQNNLFRLNGAGFAARKEVLLKHPLPENPTISDDRFINYKYYGKIKVLYDAIVICRQPSLFDHFVQRSRHIRDRKFMLQLFPELNRSAIEQGAKVNPRKINFLHSLSIKGKVGLLLNQIVEPFAQISARRKNGKIWPKIKSTKLGKGG